MCKCQFNGSDMFFCHIQLINTKHGHVMLRSVTFGFSISISILAEYNSIRDPKYNSMFLWKLMFVFTKKDIFEVILSCEYLMELPSVDNCLLHCKINVNIRGDKPIMLMFFEISEILCIHQQIQYSYT